MFGLTCVSILNLLFPGLPGSLVLLISISSATFLCPILAAFIERVAYKPLRQAPRLAPLITAIGISIILQTLAMIIWGASRGFFQTFYLLQQ